MKNYHKGLLIQKSKKPQAFTLIEILVALLVFAILASLTSNSIRSAVNIQEHLDIQAIRLQELELALALLEQDIQFIINQTTLKETSSFLGTDSFFEFKHQGLLSPQSSNPKSGIKKISYLCEGSALIRTSKDYYVDEEGDNRMVLSNLKNCHMAYLNQERQILTSWLGNDADHLGKTLPVAIQISLNLSDWGELSLLFPIIPSLDVYESKN